MLFSVYLTFRTLNGNPFFCSLPNSSQVKCRLFDSTLINGLGNTGILVQSNTHNVYSAKETNGKAGDFGKYSNLKLVRVDFPFDKSLNTSLHFQQCNGIDGCQREEKEYQSRHLQLGIRDMFGSLQTRRLVER